MNGVIHDRIGILSHNFRRARDENSVPFRRYSGTPSMTLTSVGVGTTRTSLKPALAYIS